MLLGSAPLGGLPLGAAPLEQPPPTSLTAPNPAGRPFPTANLTHLDPLKIQLLSSQPFSQPDWPVPRGAPAGPIGNRTHADPLKLDLLGQDRMFGGPGQVPSYDWPNPAGRRTATPEPGLNLTIVFGQLAQTPFRAFDWPVPRAAATAIANRSHLDPLKIHLLRPFAQLDWSVPRGVSQAVANRTHLDPVRLELLGQDQFFGGPGQAPANTDWPAPRAPLPGPIGNRTHLDPVRLNLLGRDQFFGAPGQVPPNTDWPVPRGAPPGPIGNRTHADPLKLDLLGQDRMFGGPGQVPSYDWPNPAGRRMAAPEPGLNLTIVFGQLAQTPFHAFDWPVPRTPRLLPIETTLNLTVLLAQPAAAVPFSAPEFPNPPGRRPAIAYATIGGAPSSTPVVTATLTTQFIVNMGRMMTRRG